MLYLFVDTETTGLIDNNETDPAKIPRLVSISWIICNSKKRELENKTYIIKPDSFVIPADSTAIHGITTEYALENGVNLLPVLQELKKFISTVNYVIGHNILYDLTIIKGEFHRNSIKFSVKKLNKYCTMLNSIQYCKLPSLYNNSYKYPKLAELYNILYQTELENQHDALADVTACMKCFFSLKKLKLNSLVV
jgi:DNA polymerase III epsilon subunit-like protein